MPRVVVTGVGPVASTGVGAAAFGAALRAGQSGISPITSFDTTGFPFVRAGEVQGFDPAALLRRLDVTRWGRSSLFAAAAARLAVDHARLDLDRVDRDRVGVVMGTTCGESQVIEQLTRELLVAGFAGMSVEALTQSPGHRLAHATSEELGVTGESLTITTACSASNYALGYAFDCLACGDADVFVAGGADSVCRWVHAGFYRLGTVVEERCAPFSRGRAGILTAEGGSALLLETLEHATARGAPILAEVLGYAVNCDAEHMVAPQAASIAACMRLAHERAGITPADVDYICAHGTGTPANDAAEVGAIRAVFGERVPPLSSIKSTLGHTMGAASGFGAIACVLAITDGFLPPTMNWTEADPELGELDVVANQSRAQRVRVVQNNGFAFGGNNAISVLGGAGVMGLAVTGWSALTGEPAEVAGLWPEPMPCATVPALAGFNARERLGRKGTSFLDRRSALAMVACEEALHASGLAITDANRARVGIALGTTWGSFKSMSDYTRETLVEDRPYLVSAALFPNTVMNCAAGQTAIRLGMRGVNATLGGGPVAFLAALRYAANAFRRGYADAMLVGAVEELTPHNAWATELLSGGRTVAGEGAAVFMVQSAAPRPQAVVDAITCSFAPGGELVAGLGRCIRRALAASDVAPGALFRVATGENGVAEHDRVYVDALAAAGVVAERLAVGRLRGDCQAATGAFQLAQLLAEHRRSPAHDGAASLLVAYTGDGGVAAAVVHGWSHGSPHRQ